MKHIMNTLAAASVASFAVVGTANAAGISVSIFDLTDFNTATNNGSGFAIEDFEGFDTGISYDPLVSGLVGSFTPGGGTGTGSTCKASPEGGNCTDLAVFDGPINGQGGLIPDASGKSLNANDTKGINWAVDSGFDFNRIVFAMTDAGDQNAKVSISATGLSDVPVDFNLGDGNEKLVVIDFGTLISGAMVSITSSKVNDSVAIDGASVGVVPLPAAAWMLLAGIGGLAAMKRRKTA